jgi:hypothetical protein
MRAFDSTGAAFGRNGRTYARALESSLRIIAAAEHGKELVVFANQARELAHHVRAGGLELLPVVMALNEAGSTYVAPKHGHPSVQVALAQAFSNSLTLPEHHRTEAPPTGRKGRFLLTRFADLKMSTAPAQLIRGLIPRIGLTVVWGPPKSGKSFVVFDAMMHVAIGEDYRSREVIHGPIVYCAFEGADGFKKRAEAFRKRHDLGDTNPPFYLVSARMDFVGDHPELSASIRSKLGTDQSAAVVLDTLNRSLPGSESSDQDMAAYIKAADAVRETFNCAVVIVHHCGIDTSRPRGHTSLTGAVDAQLAVKRDAGDNIILEVEWMKDGPEGDVVASRLEAVEVGTDDDGHPITSCVVVPVDGSVVTTTSKASRLTKAAQTALRALVEAVTECGDIPPASNHMPPGVRVVTVDQWRQYAYLMGISTSVEDRAKQQAFKRASEQLIGGGHVGFWDGHVWPAKE